MKCSHSSIYLTTEALLFLAKCYISVARKLFSSTLSFTSIEFVFCRLWRCAISWWFLKGKEGASDVPSWSSLYQALRQEPLSGGVRDGHRSTADRSRARPQIQRLSLVYPSLSMSAPHFKPVTPHLLTGQSKPGEGEGERCGLLPNPRLGAESPHSAAPLHSQLLPGMPQSGCLW